MQVVYAKEPLPDRWDRSIFLAGPSPRSKDVASWRPEALKILEEFNYDGVVFVPEDRNGYEGRDYYDYEQIEWEELCLNVADCIVFWIPRDLATLPGFTTNDEWGVWKDSGKVVFGAPPDAPKTQYQKYYAEKLSVPWANSLRGTLFLAWSFVRKRAIRSGGEREVPLYIWHTPQFQDWYAAQKATGNRLDGARVKWVSPVGPNRESLFWALHVNVYVASENRNKTNEIVLAMPNIRAKLLNSFTTFSPDSLEE